MEEQLNKPERGNKVGLYHLPNAENEMVEMPAESHPQADAIVRMGGVWIKSIEEWRADQINKKIEADKKVKEVETTSSDSDKKGK